MSFVKRDGIRSSRRGSKPEQSPALRRGREHRGVRWIGAAKLRTKNPIKIPAVEISSAHVIRLSCADTFSRPVCPEAVGTITQVLPFQMRSEEDDRQAATPAKSHGGLNFTAKGART